MADGAGQGHRAAPASAPTAASHAPSQQDGDGKRKRDSREAFHAAIAVESALR